MRAFSISMLLMLLFLIQTSQLCFCKNSAISCIEHERLALLKFRASFKNTSQGPLGSWEGSDCCKWKGVRCDTITRHVIQLELRSPRSHYKLFEAKNMNPSLLELEHLNYLDLSGNDFSSSPIPSFLGSMKRLRYLNLSSSLFSGRISHHLGNLSNLRVLDLSWNWGLYDDDMGWISKLSSLKQLALNDVNLGMAYNLFQVLDKLSSLSLAEFGGCRISNIHIPRGLVNSTFLANVEVLNLQDNDLGSIPDDFQNMTSIRDLDLSWNSISLVPHWLGNLHSLVHLDLSHNIINGIGVSIESILRNTCFLRSLDLSHNLVPTLKFGHGNLSGCTGYVLEELLLSESGLRDSLPTWLWKLKWLRVLDLSGNYLNGIIPDNIRTLSTLTNLQLSDNQLNGSIPTSLGRLSNLTVLDVSNNQLKGTVPQGLGLLVNLETLRISNNSLHGTFSELHLGNLSNLQELEIGLNNLDVKIHSNWTPPFEFLHVLGMSSCNFDTQFPQWLKNLKHLKTLDLSNNNVGGTIPNWIQEMNGMNWLDLSNNRISGSIPENLGDSMLHLLELNLKNNLLEGPIPNSLCKMMILSVLDLSDNRLSGTIPNCWRHRSIDIINLSSNKLSGTIPISFGHSFGLAWLNLSNNSLHGEIHEELKNIKYLAILDLGGNQFSGIIPSWIQTF